MMGLRVRMLLGHECLSLVSFVCSQVEVCARGRSHVQRSPAGFVYVCVYVYVYVCVCICVCVCMYVYVCVCVLEGDQMQQ